jgi:hypothetical protein
MPPNGMRITRRARAGNPPRYRASYKARGASIFAGDSSVACMRWLGSDFGFSNQPLDNSGNETNYT